MSGNVLSNVQWGWCDLWLCRNIEFVWRCCLAAPHIDVFSTKTKFVLNSCVPLNMTFITALVTVLPVRCNRHLLCPCRQLLFAPEVVGWIPQRKSLKVAGAAFYMMLLSSSQWCQCQTCQCIKGNKDLTAIKTKDLTLKVKEWVKDSNLKPRTWHSRPRIWPSRPKPQPQGQGLKPQAKAITLKYKDSTLTAKTKPVRPRQQILSP